jgi:glutamate racemase
VVEDGDLWKNGEAPGFALFDSGMGGLSVLRHFLELFPGEDFLYLGDMARFPYGTKSREAICRFAVEDADLLVGFRPKTLVAACFTVSSQALDVLVSRYPTLRVVGMVEAGARAALAETRTGHIGVLGTEGTIRSGAYPAILSRIGGGQTRVEGVACPLFAPMVEEGWIDGEIPERIAREYLAPFVEGRLSEVDTLILGCTHYPPLLPMLRRILPHIVFVDPGRELARAEFLRHRAPAPEKSGRISFLVTDGRERFRRVGQHLLGRPVEDVRETVVPAREFSLVSSNGGFL